MAVYKRKKSRFWWYSIYLPHGRPRLCGSTGKEDLNEALAVEAVLRQAHAGTSTRDRLVSVIDALSGGRRDGLPLVGIWDGYYG